MREYESAVRSFGNFPRNLSFSPHVRAFKRAFGICFSVSLVLHGSTWTSWGSRSLGLELFMLCFGSSSRV